MFSQNQVEELYQTELYHWSDKKNLDEKLSLNKETKEMQFPVFICYDEAELNEADQKLLDNILKSISKEGSLILICGQGETVPLHWLKKKIKFEVMLSFGLVPRQLGLNFNPKPFHLTRLQDCSILHAPGIGELHDKEQKLKLWSVLKSLFQAG